MSIENEKKAKNYFMALDIGVESVGWCAINEDFSLVKAKGKHLWGSVLFEEGKAAVERRTFRASRRRIERRKERIRLLRQLMQESINKVDPNFYSRLDNSFLLNVKKDQEFGRDNLFNLFDGTSSCSYTDRDYYKNYKTIYHLRYNLCVNKEQADIRLIYLALHHIIKYRGNFLRDEEKIDISGKDLASGLNSFFEEFNNYCEINGVFSSDDDGVIEKINDNIDANFYINVLRDKSKRKGERNDILKNLWDKNSNYRASGEEIAKLLLGYKGNVFKLFMLENDEEIDKKDLTISFDEGYEEKEAEFPSKYGDDVADLIGKLHSLYMDNVFCDLIGSGNELISQGMIAKYEQHKKDLRNLKNLLRDYPNKKKEFFRSNIGANYTNYVKTNLGNTRYSKGVSEKEFRQALVKLLSDLPDSEEKTAILLKNEKGEFLSKINSVKNAAIPYQINLKELEMIIDNQSKYYPELKENKNKIVSLLTFRRPYSVGVLKPDSDFSWFTKEIQPTERVYPWNFYEVVDTLKASENFITRMTSNCTILKNVPVIPSSSLLYQAHNVLNELANIKIKEIEKNERQLSILEKQSVFNELFLTKTSVSAKDLCIFLLQKYGIKVNPSDVTGLSDKNKFTSKMSSYIKLKQIGFEPFIDGRVCEEIIKDLTIFKDKKIRKQVLKKLKLDEDIIQKLLKINFDGWGSFSKELLNGIKGYNGETIIETMYNSQSNFNSIVWNEKLGFKEQTVDKVPDKIEKVTYETTVKDLYLSPSVKRSVWQAVKVVKEVVKVMGLEPQGIYIESTRTDSVKKAVNSKKQRLEDLYKSLKNQTDEERKAFYNADNFARISDKDNNYFNNDMIYLYFLQQGKSMYSQKNLGDINYLSENCEIDHIVPRCYIKDDSFDNRVLVLKDENQIKSGTLVLPKETREKMKPFWEYLLKNHFISKYKYKNLTKESFSDADREHFIERQLVETNQAVKAIRDLFKKIYIDSDVEMVKAGISTGFREAQIKEGNDSFYKLRDLNDFHHAKDAYLAGVIARFTRKVYPVWGAKEEARLLRDEIHSLSSNIEVSLALNKRYGIVVDCMKNIGGRDVSTSNGKIDWNNCYVNILKCFDFNDCLVTKDTEISANGGFYKQTIFSPRDNKGDIPLRYGTTRNGERKPLPIELYGNYSSLQCKYFVNVTYNKAKNKETLLMGVPVNVAYQSKTDSNAVKNYFEKLLQKDKKSLVAIDNRPVLQYQLIKYNGQLCYITSASYLINAVQLIVDKKYNCLLYAIAHPKKKFAVKGFDNKISLIDNQNIFESQMKEFCLHYAEKIKKHYPLYVSLAEGIVEYVNSENYNALVYYDEDNAVNKVNYIKNILKLSHAASCQLDMKKFGGVTNWGVLSGKSIYKNKVDYIFQSITGIYEKVEKAKELVT